MSAVTARSLARELLAGFSSDDSKRHQIIAARNSIRDFTLYTNPTFQLNWHHEYIFQKIDDFFAGLIRFLMLCVPPRHSKSEIGSRNVPAYAFGKNPNLHVIATSYGADLAKLMNRDVQRVLDGQPYREVFPDTRLNSSNVRTLAGSYQRNSDIFEIVGHKGQYRSAGVGGGITGMGFDIGVIDDPLKSMEVALSPTMRQKIWEWYLSTFYTRQSPNAQILLIGTRWHPDDLFGRIIEHDVDNEWEIINFPAIAEGELPDYDPRQEGEALWPARFDIKFLEKTRELLGSQLFSALYQQNPIRAVGRLFEADKIEIVDYIPEVVTECRFWDLAITAKTRASYTVGLHLGITFDEKLVIFDVVRLQAEAPEVHHTLKQTAVIDGRGIPIRIEAEKAGLVELQYMLRDSDLRGFNMTAEAPKGDKLTRAGAVATRVNAGRVMMVKGSWNRTFLDELGVFPGSTWSDQVDAFSGAYQSLTQTETVANIPNSRRGRRI